VNRLSISTNTTVLSIAPEKLEALEDASVDVIQATSATTSAATHVAPTPATTSVATTIVTTTSTTAGTASAPPADADAAAAAAPAHRWGLTSLLGAFKDARTRQLQKAQFELEVGVWWRCGMCVHVYAHTMDARRPSDCVDSSSPTRVASASVRANRVAAATAGRQWTRLLL
jgi:hypothetical protein